MDNRSIYTQRGSTCSHSIGVYYYDDAVKNIEAVETLQDEYPDVEFNLYHVIDE